MHQHKTEREDKLRWRCLVASFIVFCASTNLSAVFAWDRAPIKSYEIESKVFDACNRSDQLIASRNFEQAISLLKGASANDPTSYSPYLHKNLAKCYRENKQFKQAISEAETAIRFDPNMGSALYELALSYYESDQYQQATHYLRKLSQDTRDADYAQRAKTLLVEIETYGNCKLACKEINAGHLEAAKKLLLAAVSHDPSPVSATAHFNLAYVYRQTGNPEQAVIENKKAIQFKPDDKDAYYSLAICCQDIGHFSDAVGYLQRYQQLESDPQKLALAQDFIKDLNQDKSKLDESSNALPDYLEHMVGGAPLRRWSNKSMPIKVYISNGKGTRGYKSSFTTYVTHALNTWCLASANKLSYKIVSSNADSDIDVAWIDQPVLLNEHGRRRRKQGVAEVESAENVITHVNVNIDCMHAFDTKTELSEGEAATVCMHELGHSLGLDHSANYSDVMYFGASAKQKGLPTNRDRNTIALLYKAYPTSTQIMPVIKPPLPEKFVPPPAFVPPEVPNEDALTPPVFVPPPAVQEDEKLTPPPFFKPPPIDESAGEPTPPVFTPPALTIPLKPLGKQKKITGTASKKGNSKNPQGSANKSPQGKKNNALFFTPPPPAN